MDDDNYRAGDSKVIKLATSRPDSTEQQASITAATLAGNLRALADNIESGNVPANRAIVGLLDDPDNMQEHVGERAGFAMATIHLSNRMDRLAALRVLSSLVEHEILANRNDY